MVRPAEYEISQLIEAGNCAIARAKLKELVQQAGSMLGAARLIGCSERQIWRWADILGVASFYNGSEGGKARWSKK